MQDEFVKHTEALPKHARDIHEGGRCDFHPLSVYMYKQFNDKEPLGVREFTHPQMWSLQCSLITFLSGSSPKTI